MRAIDLLATRTSPACNAERTIYAPLGNGPAIPCGERALPQTPWDALKH